MIGIAAGAIETRDARLDTTAIEYVKTRVEGPERCALIEKDGVGCGWNIERVTKTNLLIQAHADVGHPDKARCRNDRDKVCAGTEVHYRRFSPSQKQIRSNR